MAIHIGEHVQKAVDDRRYTYKEFGSLIHLNDKTIPDVYERRSMQIDLLIRICGALKIDFLKLYYEEEPLKSLRNDELTELQKQIKLLEERNEILERERLIFETERNLQAKLIASQNENILLLKEIKAMREQLTNAEV